MSGGDFAGTERFEVLARLGSGGMGVVYEALDRHTNHRVALKTLRANNAETLLRFKEEFRGIQHVAHPNLVSLGELVEYRGQWFFTMELVNGVDFVRYVRPEGLLDEARLRAGLPQLVYALQALHAAHKVHRDIKPSNILISRTGRLVLLDFGFIADVIGRGHHTTAGIVVGTADYMAPEQAAGDAVTAAADWYAVGVLLYRALTGKLPYAGSRLEILTLKQQRPPPLSSEIAHGVPSDLDALCARLMAIDISRRADGEAILARLGVDAAARPPALLELEDEVPFVGRQAEMSSLHDGFLQVQRGRAVTVYLTGESGVGKSALLARFSASVERQVTRAVVLRGRCHERESVPYKAVDGLVDALTRYLRAASAELAAAVLPLNISLLAQIFPTLRRVPAIASAPPPTEVQDPLEQRRRVFAAMRELMIRLAERRPLVVMIEDLQWVDADSLVLLRELMKPPDEPPILLVASARTEAGLSPVAALESAPGFSVAGASADVRHVHLGGLPDDEARQLASMLLRQAGGNVELGADAIAEEAAGHPLFIDELVQHTLVSGGAKAALPDLEAALWSRIERLGEPALKVLRVVAVAGAPLRQEDAAAAAELEFGAFADEVARLRTAKLTRTTGTARSEHIEPYHGRVAAAVLEHVDADAARATHANIALALETSGDADPEALAYHWSRCGENERAGHYAEQAAARAADALAFDRAARLYRAAQEWRPVEGAFGRRIQTRLGDALANAGRGAEAAHAYLAAADGSSVAARLELSRMAADQLLRSGHIDEGLEILDDVLRFAGVPMVAQARGSQLASAWGRVKLAARGLGFRSRDASQVSLEDLTRVDLLWTAASGLAHVDPVRGAAFQTRHLLTALGAGEPARVGRALAAEVMFSSTPGQRNRVRTRRLRSRASELAAAQGEDHLRGLVMLADGVAAAYEGRWSDAIEGCDQAETLLRERCTNAWWELTTAQVFSQIALALAGRLDDLGQRLPRRLREAEERGDLYAVTSLRVGLPVWLRLAADQPDAASAEIDDAVAGWSRRGFHAQHVYALLGRIDVDLYRGDARAARERLAAAADPLHRSGLEEILLIGALVGYAEARVAVASGDADAARRWARSVRRADAWIAALGALIEACIAPAAAAVAAWQRATDSLEAAGLGLHAAVARRRLGAATAGDGGRELADGADAWLYGERVDRPVRFAALLAPKPGGGRDV